MTLLLLASCIDVFVLEKTCLTDDSALPSSWFDASAGAQHVCGRDSHENIYCDGAATEVGLDRSPGPVVSGHDYACTLDEDGAPVCWGKGSDENTAVLDDVPDDLVLEVLDGGNVHACGLDKDDAITCWGETNYGRVEAPTGEYTSLSAGYVHSCALDQVGALSCWGKDGDWMPTEADRVGPYRVVAVGLCTTCAVGEDGALRCWGDPSGGGACTDPPDADVIMDTMGEDHAFVALSLGSAGLCGVEADGALTCAFTEEVALPDEVLTVDLSVSAPFGVAVTSDNKLVCFGEFPSADLLSLCGTD